MLKVAEQGQLWHLIAFACKTHAKDSIKTAIFTSFFEKAHKRYTKTSLLTNCRNLVCWHLQESTSRLLPWKPHAGTELSAAVKGGLKRDRKHLYIGLASVFTQQSRPTSTDYPPPWKIAAFQKPLINHIFWMGLLKYTFCTLFLSDFSHLSTSVLFWSRNLCLSAFIKTGV